MIWGARPGPGSLIRRRRENPPVYYSRFPPLELFGWAPGEGNGYRILYADKLDVAQLKRKPEAEPGAVLGGIPFIFA